MDIDKTTGAATLWMGLLGAADLLFRWPHPAGMVIALAGAAPLALRLAVIASRAATHGRIRACEAEALALAQALSEVRESREPRDGQDGHRAGRADARWHTATA
jgi:hypothetical protein